MKTEDFERLKKLCEENGFEFDTTYGTNVIVKKKTIKVEVNKSRVEFLPDKVFFDVSFEVFNTKSINQITASKFLAEQFEKYLNGEIG